MSLDHRCEEPTAIRSNVGAIFVSLELSRSTWLITSLSPGSGEKMSKYGILAGDLAALLARFSGLKQKAFARTGKSFSIVVIQEAGLDGFWIHRVLQSEGIESYVVDPASIATSRRRRRAKTDRIDGEALVRALLAYKRGEPRVCAIVSAPTPEDEDNRRLCRERKALTAEIMAGKASADQTPTTIFVRVGNLVLFPSGGANANPSFAPTAKKIAAALDHAPGEFVERRIDVIDQRDELLGCGPDARDAVLRILRRPDVGRRVFLEAWVFGAVSAVEGRVLVEGAVDVVRALLRVEHAWPEGLDAVRPPD